MLRNEEPMTLPQTDVPCEAFPFLLKPVRGDLHSASRALPLLSRYTMLSVCLSVCLSAHNVNNSFNKAFSQKDTPLQSQTWNLLEPTCQELLWLPGEPTSGKQVTRSMEIHFPGVCGPIKACHVCHGPVKAGFWKTLAFPQLSEYCLIFSRE